ncbi:hypothetical protein Tco_0215393 [Tanacetum coccineum]
MPPKRTSTSEALAMTQVAIRKLVADSVATALEVQATNMANTDNTTRPREALVARKPEGSLDLGSTRFCRKVEDGVEGCKVRFLIVLFSKDTSGSWKICFLLQLKISDDTQFCSLSYDKKFLTPPS